VPAPRTAGVPSGAALGFSLGRPAAGPLLASSAWAEEKGMRGKKRRAGRGGRVWHRVWQLWLPLERVCSLATAISPRTPPHCTLKPNGVCLHASGLLAPAH
jgi:hypothetical protein